VLIDRAVDTPRDTAEPPKVGDDRECDEGEDDSLCALREAPCGENKVVKHVRGHQHGEVERRELGLLLRGKGPGEGERGSTHVVVYIGHATHD